MKYLKFLILGCIIVLLYSCKPSEEKIAAYEWQDISIQSVGVNWRSVQMIDENVGFVGGIPLIKPKVVVSLSYELLTQDTFMYNMDYTYDDDKKQPCLYKTKNGGDTWEAVSTPFRNGVKEMFFFDTQNGYVSTFEEGVFKTKDGGLSWERVLGQVYYGKGKFEDASFCLHFSDAENGYCYYDSWTYFNLKTTDGGATWEKIENVPGEYIHKTNETGYVLLDRWLYKTSDDGNNWEKLNLDDSSINDIYFYDAEHFLVVTDVGFMETTNGGETWKSYTNLPVEYEALKIELFGNEAYILGPKRIYHFPNVFQADWKGSFETFAMARQYEGRIFDISFPSPNIGLAVGDGGTILRYKK